MSGRTTLLAESAVLLTAFSAWADDRGCGQCDEAAGNPTFVQHEVRRRQTVQQLRLACLQGLEKLRQEIARLAAVQAADTGSAIEAPAAENASSQVADTPDGNSVAPAGKVTAPKVQDARLPASQGEGL
jgi:hypothetical protein